MTEQQLLAPQPWYRRVWHSTWLWSFIIAGIDIALLTIAQQTRDGWNWFIFWAVTLIFLSLLAADNFVFYFNQHAHVRLRQAKARLIALRNTAANNDNERASKAGQTREYVTDMPNVTVSFTLSSRYFAVQPPGDAVFQVFMMIVSLPFWLGLVLFDTKRESIIILGVLFFYFTLFNTIKTCYQWRPTVMTRDARGLVWRRWRTYGPIPWQDVRSVCLVDLPDVSTPRSTVWYSLYLVDTPAGILSWGVSARTKAARREASEQALTYILEQTDLPLYNLTSEVQEIIATAAAPRPRQTIAERINRGNRWLQILRFVVYALPSLVTLALIVIGLYAQFMR